MMLAQLQYIKYSILAVLLFSSCAGDGPLNSGSDKLSSAFVTVHGTLFRDQHQRELILNGIKLIVKDPEVKFTDLTSGTILSIESTKEYLNRELVMNF